MFRRELYYIPGWKVKIERFFFLALLFASVLHRCNLLIIPCRKGNCRNFSRREAREREKEKERRRRKKKKGGKKEKAKPRRAVYVLRSW